MYRYCTDRSSGTFAVTASEKRTNKQNFRQKTVLTLETVYTDRLFILQFINECMRGTAFSKVDKKGTASN